MKRIGWLGIVVMLVGGSAFADTAPSSKDMGAKKTGPCAQVWKACESAGFVKGKSAPSGKNLYKDCMKPVMDGKTVEGVTVDASTVQACQKAKGSHHKKGSSSSSEKAPAPAPASQ